MKRALFLSLFLSVANTSYAADYEWSGTKQPPNLKKGHFGSEFNFELEQYRKPYSPEMVAKASLQFGLLDRWQMNLELREDFVFYTNSIALSNQVMLISPEDDIYNLTMVAHLRYRLLVDDHSEFSAKLVANQNLFNDKLVLGYNLFIEAINKVDQSIGASLGAMLHIFDRFSAGPEWQFRVETEEKHFNGLIGLSSHINIKTEPIPMYYSYKKQKLWKSGYIHRVDAHIDLLKGVTGDAPKWIIGFGISLSL